MVCTTRASAATPARRAPAPSLPPRLRTVAVTLDLNADDHEMLAWYIGQPHVRGAYGSVADLLVEQVDQLVSDICDWEHQAARAARHCPPRGGSCGPGAAGAGDALVPGRRRHAEGSSLDGG